MKTNCFEYGRLMGTSGNKCYFRFRMARLCAAVIIAAAVTTEISGEELTVEIGKTRRIGTRTEVSDTKVMVDEPTVARARFYDGRLEIRGVTAGKAKVTFSGKVVRWVTGIPRHEPGRKGRLRPTPLREDYRFEDIVMVTVTERKAPTARPAVEPGDGVPGQHRRAMEVQLSKMRNVDFYGIGSRLRNVVAISADPGRVRTVGGGNWAQITGRATGDATVIVRGECWTVRRKWERFVVRFEVSVK